MWDSVKKTKDDVDSFHKFLFCIQSLQASVEVGQI